MLVSGLVLLEEIVCVSLGRGFGVWGIEEFLNAEEDLFDGDGGFPAFFLVENRETDRAGGVDIGVEEGRCEFACLSISTGSNAEDNNKIAYTLEAWLGTL